MTDMGDAARHVSLKYLRALQILCLSQDNVFVTIVASIQYQAVRDQVEDAFYRLVDPQAQIRSYVFDGKHSENTLMCAYEPAPMCLMVATVLLP